MTSTLELMNKPRGYLIFLMPFSTVSLSDVKHAIDQVKAPAD